MSVLDQDIILKRRQAAAKTYDQSAIVQREIMNRLRERLEYMLIKPKTILDLSGGFDYEKQQLQNLYPEATIASLGYSAACRINCEDHSQDLIISNLLLHWVDDPQAFLKEIARVLDPQGVLLLTTLGLDTLKECRSAFAACDQSVHVHDFFDMHDVGDQILALGFTDPVVDTQYLTVNYKNVEQLFDDLRACGKNNAHPDRQRGLMGKNKWKKMLDAYAEMKIEGSDKIPGTYEIIFGHAWGVRVQSVENGETSISLSAMEKMLKK
jgi:malonyl-CoA O-methyltransferase